MLRHSSQSTPTLNQKYLYLTGHDRSAALTFEGILGQLAPSIISHEDQVTEDAGADAFHDRGIARSTHPRCCISSKRRSNFKWAIFPVVYYSKYTCRMNTTHKSILSRL